MKRILKISLCTFILVLSVFAVFRINTNAKTADKNGFTIIVEETDNIKKIKNEKQMILERKKLEQEKIKKEKLERERLEKAKTTISKTTTVKKAVPKKNPTTRTNSVKYGTYGRLYVPGYSVALYDFNVNTQSSLSLQTIVNNQDSAAYYINNGKYVIADHYYQGFSALANLNVGATSYIRFKDGSIIRYKMIKKSRGVNTGPDLVDNNGNSFFNMNSDIIMYTCYEDGIMVTLWNLA